MRYLKLLPVLGLAVLLGVPKANAAEVRFEVGIGAPVVAGPPVCDYGYYDYAPYACAPYGFYGPDYFVGGVFIGAGPWFHEYRGRPEIRRAPERYDRRWVAPTRPVVRRDFDRRDSDRRGFDTRGFDNRSGSRGNFRGGARR